MRTRLLDDGFDGRCDVERFVGGSTFWRRREFGSKKHIYKKIRITYLILGQGFFRPNILRPKISVPIISHRCCLNFFLLSKNCCPMSKIYLSEIFRTQSISCIPIQVEIYM